MSSKDPAERPKWYDDLIRQYDPFLRNYCRTNFVFDEDLYQEAHIGLLKTWRTYRPGKSIIPWMRYAVMNARRGSRAQKPDIVYGEDADTASIDANQDVLALASVALDSLLPSERSDFALYLQGYTFEEIGHDRGVQRQAIHERYRRTVQRLRPANDNAKKAA